LLVPALLFATPALLAPEAGALATAGLEADAAGFFAPAALVGLLTLEAVLAAASRSIE